MANLKSSIAYLVLKKNKKTQTNVLLHTCWVLPGFLRWLIWSNLRLSDKLCQSHWEKWKKSLRSWDKDECKSIETSCNNRMAIVFVLILTYIPTIISYHWPRSLEVILERSWSRTNKCYQPECCQIPTHVLLKLQCFHLDRVHFDLSPTHSPLSSNHTAVCHNHVLLCSNMVAPA
jgi:hypothetical protein